jgi:glycosyltransferase involved in cell wall biosynthesis
MSMDSTLEVLEKPRVVVVIPCFNEASSIGKVVRDFRGALPDARIVVVDNASTDATATQAIAAGAEVARESRRGKGFALLTGVRKASPADIFVMVDGDDTYPAESVHQLISSLQAYREVRIRPLVFACRGLVMVPFR